MFSPLQGGCGLPRGILTFFKICGQNPNNWHGQGTLIKIPAHGTKFKVQLRYIDWTTFNICCTGCRKYQTHKKLFRHTFSILYVNLHILKRKPKYVNFIFIFKITKVKKCSLVSKILNIRLRIYQLN